MKLVQHPNVVRLYEVIDTQTKLYLILELGDGGDLYDYIMRHDSGLSEEVLSLGDASLSPDEFVFFFSIRRITRDSLS